MTTGRDNSMGEGVYFAHKDYATFTRRFLALLIDFTAFIVLFSVADGVISVIFKLNVEEQEVGRGFFLIFMVSAWLYLAVLKRSKLRTVGYRLTGIKIVDLKGQRPSLFKMTFRLLLWTLGPFNLLYDFLWIWSDSDQQSLRDCFAGTCVIKADAQPIGTAPIHLAYYNAFLLTLAYPRVIRPKPEVPHQQLTTNH